jgi:molybdenum cofactor synthesis domain-containing protein
MTTAAAIIIGDEILSGKVDDTNTPLVIGLLRQQGVELRRVVFIGDDPEEIATEVRACSDRYDAVITSGGLGPTHDDRTVEGVARAFGVQVARSPEVEAMIRTFWSDRLTEAALTMADMPEGGRLIFGADGLLPLVAFRNVYLLPGIPRLFEAKLPCLRSELEGRRPEVGQLFLRSDESSVADRLTRVDEEFDQVKIGSYPRMGEPDHRLWITLECPDPEQIRRAMTRLLELLADHEVVRVVQPDADPEPAK